MSTKPVLSRVMSQQYSNLNVSAVQLGSLRMRQREQYKRSMLTAALPAFTYTSDVMRDSWEPYRSDPDEMDVKPNRL